MPTTTTPSPSPQERPEVVTGQTGMKGLEPLLEYLSDKSQTAQVAREIAIIQDGEHLDTKTFGPVLVTSSSGGVSIETDEHFYVIPHLESEDPGIESALRLKSDGRPLSELDQSKLGEFEVAREELQLIRQILEECDSLVDRDSIFREF